MKKKILITGATRGLGAAMASEFVRLGHTVIGCGRDPASVKMLAASCGVPHDFQRVDVVDDHAVIGWARAVLATHGPPDLLVNNAAIINRNAALWEVPAEEFSTVVDVNIKGVTNVIRHFVPSMIQRGTGVIVNFSSGWGRSVSSEVAPYCATKFAVEGLTQAMAQELPSGLAAIPLNPGIINTEMLQSCFGSSASSFPDADDWAKTAVPFLLKLGPAENGRSLTAP